MIHDEGVLRKVAWAEICPWLSLARCVRLAFRFRALLLSAIAILATLSGWVLIGYVFSGGDSEIARQLQPYQRCPWLGLMALVPDRPFAPEESVELGAVLQPRRPVSVFTRAWDPLIGSWEQLSRPFLGMFAQGVTVTRLAFLVLSGLWAVVVWAFFAGAVTRSTAVELAAGERIGWGAMVRFAVTRWPAYVAAPLLPLLAVLMAVLASVPVGMLLWSGAGTIVAALLWPLVLLGWALIALLLLGLLFGWPLMWPAISAEGSDSYDALSRAYNYLFSRPLHALFYAMVAVGLGALGWLLVSNFAAAVVYLTYWAVSWVNAEQTVALIQTGGPQLGVAGRIGAGLIRFWAGCVKLLAVGFLYSYLWSSATGIYYLLRRDVDAREMDEVFLENEGPEEGLPRMTAGPSGVPEVTEG